MSGEGSPRRVGLDVAWGAGLAFLLALASLGVLIPLAFIGVGESYSFAAVLFIGISQVVYIVPAVLIARRRGRAQIATGLILGAALILLLNVALVGLFIWDVKGASPK